MIDIEVTDKWYTKQYLQAFPHSLFIFGDNMVGQGTGGQAVIRHCVNAFGIPTKRLPSRYPSAYMSDQYDEEQAILTRLALLKTMEEHYTEFKFPADGLGTGLAEMPIKSPKLFKMMNYELNKRYGVYEQWA